MVAAIGAKALADLTMAINAYMPTSEEGQTEPAPEVTQATVDAAHRVQSSAQRLVAHPGLRSPPG